MKENRFRKTIIFAVLLAVLLCLSAAAAAENVTESIQDHVWDNGTFYKAADCDHPEQWIFRCTVPGCSAFKYEYKGATNPNAHVWGDWITDAPSTCTTTGTRHRVCTIVNHHIEYGTIAPMGHDWGDWFISKKPTCLDPGEESRVCKNDPSHTQTREVPPTGHNWGEWTVTTPPTCLTGGEETRVCKNDPTHRETREIKPLGHDWGDWVVTKKPTCLDPGEETRTCRRDPSHTETRVKPATGHDWGEWVITKKPTCNDPGQETRTCKNDPTHKETREIKPTGHNWDDGTIIVYPTMEDEGIREYVCKNDPTHTRREKIAKLTRYGNTLCAFGPRLRDTNQYHVPSERWYMYTPVDVSVDGIQKYELVASNELIVGELTLTVRDGNVYVDYTLVDNYNFKVTLEFFTILHRIDDLTKFEPEELLPMAMKKNVPINLEENFGDDTNLVLYFCSRCDYSSSPRYLALRYESAAHRQLLNSMFALMNLEY